MVTFLSERLQHKQRKTLKVLIAADSETDLCAVSTPSLYNKVMMLWKIQEWISEDHDTRWKYAIPNLADQSSSQLLTQTLMFCLSTAGTNQSANQLYRYGKHSSQKMEPTTKTRAGTSPESCWLWGEILSLKVNHPVMWATTLRQVCGPPFLPETPLQEAENSMQWPRRAQFHDTQWLSTPDHELYPQFGIVELWITN